MTTVIVVDAASGRQEAVLSGPFVLRGTKNTSLVTAMAFSPDGRWLATGGIGLTQVWDLASGLELQQFRHVFPLKSPHSQEEYQFPVLIRTMVFSPDGRFLATNGVFPRNAATLWEAATGKLIARLPNTVGHEVLTFSPDSRLLAIAAGRKVIPDLSESSQKRIEEETGQRLVIVYDAATGSERCRLIHEDAVFWVAFSPDGKLVATSSGDGTTRLWEAETGREIARLGKDGPHLLAFHAEGKQLLTVSKDYCVQVWEPPPAPEVRLNHDGPVHTLAFSPDGRWLATGIMGKSVLLWDASTGREITRLTNSDLGHELVFSPDGSLLATIGWPWGKTNKKYWFVLLYQVPGGKELARLVHPDAITAITFTPDGSRLITGCWDGDARIWNLVTGKEILRLGQKKTDDKDRDFVRALALSPDGRLLAVSYGWHHMLLWTLADGRGIGSSKHGELPSSTIPRLAFSKDSRWLAGGNRDDGPDVWDTTTGKLVAKMASGGWAEDLAFNPTNPWLVTGSPDWTARVWELPGGREVAQVMHKGPVAKVAFSPDGRYVASAEKCPGRSLVRVWEAATGVEVAKFAHAKEIWDVAFSPDGRLIASASSDGTARLWRWQPEDLIRQACSRLTRNLTRAEWRQYLGDEPYRPTCPELPVPED